MLPLLTVVDGVTSAHRRLMHMLDNADDDELAQVGVATWGAEMSLVDLFYEMGGHYTDHVRDLKAYQGRCLEGCP